MEEISTLKKNKNLLLIGLVNQDEAFLGETQHYNRLHKYLNKNILGLVYSLSISNNKKDDEIDFYVKYPSNTLIRLLYWNFYITIKSIFLLIFKDVGMIYMRFNSNQIILPMLLITFKIKYALEINSIVEKKNKYLMKLHKKIMSNSKFIIGAPGYMNYLHKEFDVGRDKLKSISLGYNFKQAKIYNPKEIADNGIDDDNNGYVDDIYGWNFLGNENGKSAKFVNYEYTRILKKYTPIFNNSEYKTDLDSSLYVLYRKAKKSTQNAMFMRLRILIL